MDRKDITLNLENNVLTLRGERRFLKEAKEENYHRIERSYGGFSRAFSIPATVDEEKIRASGCDGYMAKPIAVSNLLDLIETLITRSPPARIA